MNENNTDIINKLINLDISENKPEFPPVGDFHTANGIAFFGRDKMEETYKNDYYTFKNVLRDTAKRMGLALCYGLGWKGLLPVADNSETKAKEMHFNFFKNLPVVSKNMQKLLNNTKRDLYLTNLVGRRLYVRAWESDDWRDIVNARNSTLNYGIQSLGADLTKMIIYKLNRYIEKNYLDRNAGNLIIENFCSRILTLEIDDDTDTDDLEFELDCLEAGHTKIVLTKNGKPYLEYDRNVKISMRTIKQLNLKIYH